MDSGTSHSQTNNRFQAYELSYREMTTDANGRIVSAETKTAIRKQQGYCLQCPLVPVQLVQFKRSRLNPLWTTKKLMTVPGESFEGKCLKCHPELDPSSGKLSNDRGLQRPCLNSTESTLSLASTISDVSTESFAADTSNQAKSSPKNEYQTCRGGRKPPRPSRSAMILPRGTPIDATCKRSAPIRSYSYDTDRPPFGSQPTQKGCHQADKSTKLVSFHNLLSEQSTRPEVSKLDEAKTRRHGEELRSKRQDLSEAIPTTECSRVSLSPDKVINDLVLLFQDMKATGSSEIMSDIIVEAMQSHQDNTKVQEFCVRTIVELFNEETTFDSTLFITAKGDKRILAAMKKFRGSMALQQVSCDALALLATNERNRKTLVANGCCESIVEAISGHEGNPFLISNALVALRILSVESEVRILLENLSTTQLVVETMRRHLKSSSIQRDGCALLSNMAVDAKNKKVAAVGYNVIAAVSEAMTAHPTDENVISNAYFALKNFSYDEGNVRMMRMVSQNGTDLSLSLQRASEFESVLDVEYILEKIYMCQAQDESLEEEAMKTLNKAVVAGTNTSDSLEGILNILDELQWSYRIFIACVEALYQIGLKSESHFNALKEKVDQAKIQEYAKSFNFDGIPTASFTKLVDFMEASYDCNREIY